MLDDRVSKSLYKQKVRVRACGILIKDNSILMLKHVGIGNAGHLWAPPGGGVEFNESCEQAVIKEFKEETGLNVSIDKFLFTNEYRSQKLHAVEIFFQVCYESGELLLGNDPEVPEEEQILKEIKWVSFDEITEMNPRLIHNAFHNLSNPSKIVELQGFIKFEDISIK
ncbi:MAG: NUDIX hydrolase [Marinoscillum sp.]